ncbi:mandelate racemase/muconate lactonizing enzyme family protein [Micromonospora echinofusca]|uniref:Mandelate racemase/muconate lactonizing enzyme family protein n=2 Tax=Micromonospora echinofusca TaxID=47858 RepID=A0ABS3VV57_MICEH|nr:mandelate racemase/muconate lactonizing enzyme family protein [Micromonospora echinofusca]
MTHRSTIVTRIHTRSGIVGEAYAGDEDAGLREINEIIHREIAPAILGKDAFATERLWELARPATWDILRDRRLGLVACASVDTAVWDAVGRALNIPLHRLWGGYRTAVPVITIGGYYSGDADIHAEVTAVAEAGYAGMKFKVGGLTPAEDADRVRQARKAGGDDFALAVDANQGWSPAEAIRFAQLVSDCDLLWFEEPCHWHNDRRGMRDVRLAGATPVCAGQSEFSAGGCRDLFESGSVDYCNFDASWSGGPTEWRRVAGMAAAYDVRMAHHEEPQIAAHLLASVSHGTYLENFHPQRDPIWHNLVANRPPLQDGHIRLPERPGLGWELDHDYIERYRIEWAPGSGDR